MTTKVLFIFFIFLLSLSISAQDQKRTDSLLSIVKTPKENIETVNAYCDLCREYIYSSSDSSRLFIEKGLELALKLSYLKGIADCYTYLGVININQSDFPLALDYYQKSLKTYEKLSQSKSSKDVIVGRRGMSQSYGNIGNVHMSLENYSQSLNYYKQAIEINKELKDDRPLATNYSNMGVIYFCQQKNTDALKYILESLKIRERLGDKAGISDCYGNLGLIYDSQKNYKKAIEFFQKGIRISEELGNKNSIANNYSNMVVVNIELKNYTKAIDCANKSLSLSKDMGILYNQGLLYSYLSEIYDSLHDYKNAYEFQKLFKITNDSIFNEESSNQLKDMEARYQNEKKQKEIELLNKDKELQQIEIQKQTTQKYAFIGGFALMLILALVTLFGYSKIKEQKRLIENKNSELNQRNEEISAQRDEIETQRDEISAQRDIVTIQKNNIEDIHNKLTSSIRYAERIQHAVLPSEEFTQMFLSNHFILFKPCEIVSGDFYWTMIKKNMLLVAVADCTGHGVPGAFMSMLGISFLNEIIAQSEEITQASFILNTLREYVIKSLQQYGITGEQKDGMDISLVALNLETNQLHFAGANNPLYIVKSEKLKDESKKTNDSNEELSNFQLYELKGDKMPIAIHVRMDAFTNHETKLEPGDTFYLFSDGYADQFGGPKGKKLMYSNFKKILLENSAKTMEEQKTILDLNIENWKNGFEIKNEQTDDITIIGIRL